MGKFVLNSGHRLIKRAKVDKWAAKYESVVSSTHWIITWVRLYDMVIWFDTDHKIWVVANYHTTCDPTLESVLKAQQTNAELAEWAPTNIRGYKEARVIARRDLRREAQQLIGKKSLEYMNNVLTGTDNYDD